MCSSSVSAFFEDSSDIDLLEMDHIFADVESCYSAKEFEARIREVMNSGNVKSTWFQTPYDSNPFEFTHLPLELQQMVAKNLNFFCFKNLKRTSRAMRSLCEGCERGVYRPEFKVDWVQMDGANMENTIALWRRTTFSLDNKRTDIRLISATTPCNLIVDRLTLTSLEDSTCEVLRGMGVSSIIRAEFHSVSCAIDVLVDFLEYFRTKALGVVVFPDMDNLLCHSMIQKLPRLAIGCMTHDVANHDLDTPLYSMESLLPLRAGHLRLAHIEMNVIRTYMEEWMHGTRDIWKYDFCNITDIDIDRGNFMLDETHGVFEQLIEDAFFSFLPCPDLSQNGHEGDLFDNWHEKELYEMGYSGRLTCDLRGPYGVLRIYFTLHRHEDRVSFSAKREANLFPRIFQ